MKKKFTLSKKKMNYILAIIFLTLGFRELRSDSNKDLIKNLNSSEKLQKLLPFKSEEVQQTKVKKKEALVKKQNNLIKHQQLRAKAILSREEREELDRYFMNSRNIRVAYLTLLSKDFSNLDESIEKRIDATNFLIDGLQRKHIDRSELIKSTEMFLLSSNEEDTQDTDIRRAIIGDKVDLYNALINFAPEDAKRFKRNYMSERLKKVIQYVELNKQRNRG